MTKPSPPVLCIGLTPALQRIMVFSRVKPGGVNRAVEVEVQPGGKAVNTARALRQLGRDVLVLGFSGGPPGDALAKVLNGLGIPHAFTPTRAATRICTTLIEQTTGRVTELVEESPRPSRRELLALLDVVKEHAAACAGIVLAGAAPPGLDPAWYTRILRAAGGKPALVDTSGATFKAALPAHPDWIKCNRDEQRQTGPVALKVFAAETLAGGAGALLVTDGAGSAHLFAPGEQATFTPPRVRAINAVGSGDATSAGIMQAWLNGASRRDAVAFGMQCGAANVRTRYPGDLGAFACTMNWRPSGRGRRRA
ncbi:MAG TPA: PfkB family carbohydrate kinase [Kiritimatiellia bacterium]|nr:PfkB family carbohydrate kinase [Kiritimatiellia bacterium]HMP00089.1 PfkB family carbohydrate kinase [Kiritimatiellia bacterium]HMP96630.1 PfkB family carbohydrate kinase [Kiritimatiellia bacterium]